MLRSSGVQESLQWPPLQQQSQPPMPSGGGLPSIRFPQQLYNTLKAEHASSIKAKRRKAERRSSASDPYPVLRVAKTTPKPSVIFFPTNENEGCAEANGIGKKAQINKAFHFCAQRPIPCAKQK